MQKKKGLGDKVESVIKTISPRVHKKFKDCPGCKKRKAYLNNNVGAIFG